MTEVDGSRKRPPSVDDEGPNQTKRQRISGDLLQKATSNCSNIAAESDDQQASQLETTPVGAAKPEAIAVVVTETETTAVGKAEPEDEEARCFLKAIFKTAHHLTQKFVNGLKDLLDNHEKSEDGENSTEEGAALENNVHVPSPDYQGQFYRMGVHLRKEQRGFKIARLFEETIAHKAHLKKSDIITHLDDVDLKEKNLVEVLRMFGKVKKDFKVMVLREVKDGKQTHLKLTIHITISTETDEQTFKIDVNVWAPRYLSVGQTSGEQYITQDGDNRSEVYMYEENGALRMGGVTDRTAIFVLEFYIPDRTRDGQVCRIRNTSSNQVIDVSTKRPITRSNPLSTNALFNKRYRPDGSYVFESIKYQGQFLTNNSGNIQLTRHGDVSNVSSSSQFMLYDANQQRKPRNRAQNATRPQQQRRQQVNEMPTHLK